MDERKENVAVRDRATEFKESDFYREVPQGAAGGKKEGFRSSAVKGNEAESAVNRGREGAPFGRGGESVERGGREATEGIPRGRGKWEKSEDTAKDFGEFDGNSGARSKSKYQASGGGFGGDGEARGEVKASRSGLFGRRREGGALHSDWLKKKLDEVKRGERGSMLYGLGLFLLGVIFARCHTVFGARPLGIVLAALLPEGVWVATAGCAVGALTLGSGGVIYAIAALITVFLRIIISGGFGDGGRLFGESLGARLSEATVGGFIVGAYEILLGGISATTALYSAAMVLLPPLISFILSGLFNTGISIRAAFVGPKSVFSLAGKNDTDKLNSVFFGLSALSLLFFITLSLEEFTVFGISASYIFTAFVTLLVARRMGAVKALATGFVSSLGVSGVYAVAFGLSGLGAGLLFNLGTAYALVFGGVLLGAWSGYAAGLEGFLSTFPEYLIAATLYAPLCKGVEPEASPERERQITESARDMVGTVALKYQGSRSSSLDGLESSLSALGALMKGYTAEHKPLTEDELYGITVGIAERCCDGCDSLRLCRSQNISPCLKNAEKIAKKLFSGAKINRDDINTDTEFCKMAEMLADEINRGAARAELDNKRRHEEEMSAEEYELISRMICEVRLADSLERAPADELNQPLSEVARSFGFEDGVFKAFGKRRRHFIFAAEDEGGKRISSEELRLGIEAAAGVKLGNPEYYRNGKMALMECTAARSYSVECATASKSGSAKEVSGDTLSVFESSDERFFALISDGMGKGKLARDTSGFVAAFLERALDFGASRDTVLHLLNNAMLRRREECSATVDLFELDLLTGEATFVKSGSAPSFIKRGSSIFRIKSSTAPLGLMRSIDSEKIRVEVREGDLLFMLSDGVAQSAEESPWLLELLSRKPKGNLKEYAELIIKEAVKYSNSADDMSVIVAKIGKL